MQQKRGQIRKWSNALWQLRAESLIFSAMKHLLTLLLSALLFACSAPAPKSAESESPPLEQSLSEADARVLAIADKVVAAMGGAEAWEQSRYLSWNFFGSRKHYWDKVLGLSRIESLKDSMTYLLNLNTGEGQVFWGKMAMTDTDSLKKYLKAGMSMWINDSYWLVMPFKLTDPGVKLSYVGVDTTALGKEAEVLEMRFEEVGDTPQNKYRVWVEKNSNLITQWSFYADSSDTEPRFVTPWQGYEQKGAILLSGDRGRGQLTDIAVMKEVPPDLFSKLSYD